MKGEGLVIRDMEEADLPGVLSIERASFPAPWTEYMFLCQLELGDIAINLVAMEGEEVAAYAAAWVAADEIHLLSIAVQPELRRKGYAEKLLWKVIERGRERGGRCMILEVRVGNAPAKCFYDKHGFGVIGTRKGYYRETDEDAIVMELIIDRD